VRNVYYTDVRRLSAAVILLSAALLASCDRDPKPRLVGASAPQFSVQDSTTTVSLQQMRGKVVLLNFWATWCPPCVEEMPSLVALQKRLGDRMTILAVSVDEDEGEYRRFLARHRIELLTVRDAEQKSNLLYGTTRFPETYVIDPAGVVRRKFVGPVDWERPDVIAYLEKLYSATTPPAAATAQAGAGAANSQ